MSATKICPRCKISQCIEIEFGYRRRKLQTIGQLTIDVQSHCRTCRAVIYREKCDKKKSAISCVLKESRDANNVKLLFAEHYPNDKQKRSLGTMLNRLQRKGVLFCD